MHRRRAFTLLELVATVAIVAILLALLLPVLDRGLGQARRTSCISQLQNIGVAFSSWAHEHGDFFPMQVSTRQGGTREFAEAAALNPGASATFRHFQALSNELVVAKVLLCPADRQRTAASDFASLANTNVSYWVNVGATFGRSDAPVAGDRNVRTSGRTEWTYVQIAPGDAVEFSAELHGHRGQVLFGDGHVEAADSALLSQIFASANRTNASDITLSLPRRDAEETAPALSAGAIPNENPGSATTTSSAQVHSPTASPKTSNGSSASLASPSMSRPVGTTEGSREAAPVIYTLLDGTVVTGAPPRQPGVAMAPVGSSAETIVAPNPLLEFAEWITRQAARNTYWLLLLLLAALIGFELARRRAQRRGRRGRMG